MQTCEVLAEQPLKVQDQPDPGAPAAWMILGLLIALAIFEMWALRTHHNTISHLFQRLSRLRTWFRWLVGAGMVILSWHLLFGF